MSSRGKKFKAAKAQVEDRPYPLEEAIQLAKKMKFAKFDETLDVALLLGVDPKHDDQMVRGTVILPHGLGKSKRVAVITSGKRRKPGRGSVVGGDELAEKAMVSSISTRWSRP
jgi:large subunit ribosomal protein L1